MRLVLTILLAGVFAVAFTLFFACHSLLTYVTTPAGIVDTARSADTRALALDAVEGLVREQLKGEHPVVETAVVGRTRATIEEAVSSEWFYNTLAATYPGFVGYLESGDDTSVIELGAIREQLRRGLRDLADDIERDCRAILGAGACADQGAVAAFVADYRRAVDRAVADIPEQTTISELLRDAGVRAMVEDSSELRDVRRALAAARTARWIALVALVLMLALIAAINMTSLGRALIAVGASLVVAGTLHLAVIAALSGPVGDEVSDRIETRRGQLSGDLAETGEKLAVHVLERGLSDHNGVVVFLMVLGAGCVLGGVLLGRRG